MQWCLQGGKVNVRNGEETGEEKGAGMGTFFI